MDKMKNIKYHSVVTAPKLKRKSLKEAILLILTHKYMNTHFTGFVQVLQDKTTVLSKSYMPKLPLLVKYMVLKVLFTREQNAHTQI